jgi:Tol biopolymer transport system component
MLSLTLTVLAVLSTFIPSRAAAKRFSDWSAPVNLGPAINSPANDFTPTLSKDGLSVYFSSNRPGGFGLNDLWVSQRPSVTGEWELPMNLGSMINTGANEAAPHLSRDGHYLLFTSNRVGGFGSNDLWMSRRVSTHDDFAWEPPVNLGPPVNGPAFDAGATVRRPELYFTSDRDSGNGVLDIYVSFIRGDGTLGLPRLVTELSSDGNEQRPSLSFDGREIVFSSDRAGSAGSQDIWVSTRQSRADAWSPPVNLGVEINTPFQEQQPAISGDGTMLLFGSNRPGGSGGLDLYVSTRGITQTRER